MLPNDGKGPLKRRFQEAPSADAEQSDRYSKRPRINDQHFRPESSTGDRPRDVVPDEFIPPPLALLPPIEISATDYTEDFRLNLAGVDDDASVYDDANASGTKQCFATIKVYDKANDFHPQSSIVFQTNEAGDIDLKMLRTCLGFDEHHWCIV